MWVCLAQGRAGTLRRTGWRHYLDPTGSSSGMPAYLAGYVQRMAAVAERLQHVSLECRPALDLIRAFGPHPDVLLYVDPPYLQETRSSGAYQLEMCDETAHRELAAALLECRAGLLRTSSPHRPSLALTRLNPHRALRRGRGGDAWAQVQPRREVACAPRRNGRGKGRVPDAGGGHPTQDAPRSVGGCRPVRGERWFIRTYEPI